MTDEPNASATLDKIRVGGQQLMLMVQRRLIEAQEELAKGDFTSAFGRVQEAGASLGPLVAAQQHMGFAADAYMVRANELEIGMVLSLIGEVESIECADESGCACGNCEHVKVVVGGQELHFVATQQLFVDRDAEQPA
jgi:hypothetical protein